MATGSGDAPNCLSILGNISIGCVVFMVGGGNMAQMIDEEKAILGRVDPPKINASTT